MPRSWDQRTFLGKYMTPMILAGVVCSTYYFYSTFSTKFGSQIEAKRQRALEAGSNEENIKAIQEAKRFPKAV